MIVERVLLMPPPPHKLSKRHCRDGRSLHHRNKDGVSTVHNLHRNGDHRNNPTNHSKIGGSRRNRDGLRSLKMIALRGAGKMQQESSRI